MNEAIIMDDGTGIGGLGAARGPVGVAFVLQTIGFNDAGERESIMEAWLNGFKDFCYLVDKDIHDMADDFGKRTQANCCIVFGMGCTKKLMGIMHWVQDCYRTCAHSKTL